MLPLRVASSLGKFVSFRPINPALIGKERQPVMSSGGKEVIHHVIFAQLRTLNALAASLLAAVLIQAGAFDIPRTGNSDHHVLFLNQIFHRHFPGERHYLSTPLIAVFIDNLAQLGGNNAPLPFRTSQDIL